MTGFNDKFTIREGKLDFSLFNHVQAWATLQKDGNYTIKIDEQRTLQQNKILHVLIAEFRQWMFDSQGETWDDDVSKYMFKIWSGFFTKHIQALPSGAKKAFRIPKESSKMSKKKFVAWMKYTKQKWYNDFGHIPKTLLDRETADFLGL